MTLNQVIARLKLLAESHKQVKRFAYEDAVSFLNDNQDINYPAIIIEDNGFTISRTQRQTLLNFNVYVIDLLDNAKNSLENELDVYSDCLSIAEDYFALINASCFYDDWTIGLDAPAQFVKEKFTDYVGGVFFSVTIGIEYLTDRCAVPTDWVCEPSSSLSDTCTVNKYTYIANGTEGTSLYTALIGREILLHIREKTTLDAVDADPLPDEYVYDAETGYMTYADELLEGESIQILYRNLL